MVYKYKQIHYRKKYFRSYPRMRVCIVAIIAISFLVTGCSSNNRKTTGEEPFFLQENELAEHGKKTTIDRLYQLDPGSKKFEVSDKFKTIHPRKIAVLPFDNLVGGNYVLNRVSLPRLSKKNKDAWNWTYAN